MYNGLKMAIQFISKASRRELTGTAIVRLDFNDADGWRIEQSARTIKFLIKKADKLVILGHRGRPKPSMHITRNNKEFSLKGEEARLAKIVGRSVEFIAHSRISEAANEIRNAAVGAVFLLENVRFLDGEEENNTELARHLASLGDYYVNEAFANCHRAHASMVGITKFAPSYGGLRLEEEIVNLSRVMKKPRRPLVMIFGGAKADSKLPVIAHFRRRADAFLVGGALGNTLLYLEGVNIGESVAERKIDGMILKVARMKNIKGLVDARRRGGKILDIGPKTEKIFMGEIKRAKTIVWNGPLGMIEKRGFESGTKVVARAVARTKAFSVVGGGETVNFIRKLKLEKKISFLSTGGGAMLDFLAGKKLPGIEALSK